MDTLCSLPASGGSVGAALLFGALALLSGIALLAAQRWLVGGRAAPVVLLAAIAVSALFVVLGAHHRLGDRTAQLDRAACTTVPPTVHSAADGAGHETVEHFHHLVEHVDDDSTVPASTTTTFIDPQEPPGVIDIGSTRRRRRARRPRRPRAHDHVDQHHDVDINPDHDRGRHLAWAG